MSTVFIHVGQAGCQLARVLWPALAREKAGSPDLFRPSPVAAAPWRPRAILVDGEPKVIEAALASRTGAAAAGGQDFAFDPAGAAWSQSGRGGNFALGYAGEGGALPALQPDRRPDLVERALDCARREVEACHGAHLGSVLTHSLGGGTGSGLGSRLAEELRDEYPRAPLLAVSILPIFSGENPAQSFNAVLALATLQEVADCVVLYENDKLLAIAEAGVPRGSSGTDPPSRADTGVSLMAMNTVITTDLVPLLCQPSPTVPLDVGELLFTTCPMPTHRFLQTASGEAAISRGPPTDLRPVLEAFTRSAGRGLPGARPSRAGGGGSAVLAAHAVIRGAQVADAIALREGLLTRLGGAAAWQPQPLDLRISPTPLRSSPNGVRVSALVNWKRSAQVLESVAARARHKYAARVFVHWYERHGFGAAEFEHAFEVLDQVITDYEAA